MDPRTRRLLEGPVGPTLLALAWPNMLVMGAQSAIGIIETWYVSRLGADALSGMALVFPAFMFIQMASAGAVGGGILSTLARALGANERERANSIVWAAVAIALALGALTSVLALGWGRHLYVALGGQGAVLEAAATYSGVVFAAAIPLWLFNSFAAIIRAQGNMAFPAFVNVSGALLLIPLSPLLIFGWGPVPGYGIIGGGLAVMLYYSAGATILGWHIWSGRGVLQPSLPPRSSPLDASREILRIGLLSALSALATNVVVAAVMAILSAKSVEAAAGYGTAVRLEYFLIPLVFGLGAPTAAMVGTAIGARNPERALRIAWTAAALAGLITEAIGVSAALLAEPAMRLFAEDAGIITGGAEYLRFVGPAYGVYGAGFALYFAAQGAGTLRFAIIASMIRVVLVLALGALALSLFGSWSVHLLLAFAMVVYGAIIGFMMLPGRWPKPARRTEGPPTR